MKLDKATFVLKTPPEAGLKKSHKGNKGKQLFLICISIFLLHTPFIPSLSEHYHTFWTTKNCLLVNEKCSNLPETLTQDAKPP